MKRTILALFLVTLAVPVSGRAQGDFQKGISYYKQGQYAKAVQEFEQLVQADPKYESGYRVLGNSYLKLRQYDKAAKAFHQAVTLDPDNFASFLGAAVAEFNLEQYEAAVSTLESGKRSAKTPKERYQLLQLRGSSYYNLEKYPEAVSDLEQAVSIQRGEYNDVFQLGLSYLEMGNFAKARQYLEQAAVLGDSDGKAREYLQRVDYQQALEGIRKEQYPKAVATLKTFVESHPDDGDAWYNLGLAQLFSKQLDAARQSFEHSTQLSSTNWDAYRRLGYVYEVQKEYDDALDAYRKAAELKSDPTVQESIKRVRERIRRQKQSSG